VRTAYPHRHLSRSSALHAPVAQAVTLSISTSRLAGGSAFGTPSAASLPFRAAPAVATSAEFEHAKAALPAPQNQKSRLGKHDYLPLVDFILEEGFQCHDSCEPSQRH
jgi:hypothetical protein